MRIPKHCSDDRRLELLSHTLVSRGECLEWTRSLTGSGYGQASYNMKLVQAHRLFEQLRHGPIPKGVVIEHLCANKLCCRDEHLLRSTQGANIVRAVQEKRR